MFKGKYWNPEKIKIQLRKQNFSFSHFSTDNFKNGFKQNM